MPVDQKLRQSIDKSYYLSEREAVAAVVHQWPWSGELHQEVQTQAFEYTQALRDSLVSGRASLLQSLLRQFPLSSQEGVALMCLAEALLRIPDPHTRHQLIQDKIGLGAWLSKPESQNTIKALGALWGLKSARWLLNGSTQGWLQSLICRLSMPIIAHVLARIVRQLGAAFIAGPNIEDALARALLPEEARFLHSYDMLGEAALTRQDAQKFFEAYQQAIQCLGRQTLQSDLTANPGISIKLSALHPCYRVQHRTQVLEALYPVLLDLVLAAKQANLGINLDAEEADKLDLSLDLLKRLCFEPVLKGWNGIGFVVQAYQKRAPALVDYLLHLGQSTEHRLMIRLVKGAYWDAEIKRAQQLGLAEYPVYTHKAHTDAAYLVCAHKLLAAANEVCFPQFATHNVQSIVAIQQLAAQHPARRYEFQCLYGMGEPLYNLIRNKLQVPCRRYAPVGQHTELLPYLVRRLLENGANTAFINHAGDIEQPIESILADPWVTLKKLRKQGSQHPAIPLPPQLYKERKNAKGWDLSQSETEAALAEAIQNSKKWRYAARPILANPSLSSSSVPSAAQALHNPADAQDCLGHLCAATPEQIEHALEAAHTQGIGWSETPPDVRARILEQAANLLERNPNLPLALLVREAGKTQANAVSELREAIDFLRYYAASIKERFCNETHRPLGTVLCISPWNFPLAIFVGQIAGALAAGNRVIAKPASQTSLVAMIAVRSLHRAGVPRAALQLLTGSGVQVGEQLIADHRVKGVVFTGSTQVARHIQYQLAYRPERLILPIPLIAETGGLNAMIVDASAHLDQVIQDVLLSAFDSAGQRCSALRLLCIQEEIADTLIERLQGAMELLALGNPEAFSTDIGPVISSAAKAQIEDYIQHQKGLGHQVFKAGQATASNGNFVMPCLIALNSPNDLRKEVFGPVLHWVRYEAAQLDTLIEDINASGYGLTLGLHTRLNPVMERVAQKSSAGNLYINRNQVGAVVGVQPFGGEGFSGTGPKAGGPLYPYALLSRYPWAAPLVVIKEDNECIKTEWLKAESRNPALMALRHWAALHDPELAGRCERYARHSLVGQQYALQGVTGETNLYGLTPRRFVVCLAEQPRDLLKQLAASLACNLPVVWENSAATQRLYAKLPTKVQQSLHLVESWQDTTLPIDTLLHNGTYQQHHRIARMLAGRPGPIIRLLGGFLTTQDIALEWLLREQVITQNTTASGGNIQLAMLNDNL